MAGALLAEMGLKRRSRFAYAACLLGANAPDIDVFVPLVLPVDGIAFHRGPVHSVFAWPVLAAGIVAILWLVDRLKPRGPDTLPFRPGALFAVAFVAVLTHPFLDWLTTYAIAIFAPLSWRWYSGDAIFIVDWVYWLLMGGGIALSVRRWQAQRPNAGRPARVAGMLMLAYIGVNLVESAWVEHETAAELRRRGMEPTLVVAGPPPFFFWRRTVQWRSDEWFGGGSFSPASGLTIDPSVTRTGMNDPQLAEAIRTRRYVRSFLTWSRMPIVIRAGGHSYLTDQRFYGAVTHVRTPRSFFIPLDNAAPNS